MCLVVPINPLIKWQCAMMHPILCYFILSNAGQYYSSRGVFCHPCHLNAPDLTNARQFYSFYSSRGEFCALMRQSIYAVDIPSPPPGHLTPCSIPRVGNLTFWTAVGVGHLTLSHKTWGIWPLNTPDCVRSETIKNFSKKTKFKNMKYTFKYFLETL
jgi:hypothetical protein